MLVIESNSRILTAHSGFQTTMGDFFRQDKRGPKKDALDVPSTTQELRPAPAGGAMATAGAVAKGVCALVSSDVIDSQPDLNLCQSNQKQLGRCRDEHRFSGSTA
jgi:hypothetical protein